MMRIRRCLPVVILISAACTQNPSAPPTINEAGLSTSTQALGGEAAPSRELVCHRRGGNQSWNLLEVAAPALAVHLNQHDDARPGQATPSGVALDENCVPVACPCYTTADVVALFQPGEPDRDLSCAFNTFFTFIEDIDPAQDPKWLVESFEQFSGDEYFHTCEKTVLGGSDPGEIPQMMISEAEHLACVDVIGAAQIELGCR